MGGQGRGRGGDIWGNKEGHLGGYWGRYRGAEGPRGGGHCGDKEGHRQTWVGNEGGTGGHGGGPQAGDPQGVSPDPLMTPPLPPVLLSRPLRSGDIAGVTLKISDLGLAREWQRTTRMSGGGTYPWMAPEVIRASRFSRGSDVWRWHRGARGGTMGGFPIPGVWGSHYGVTWGHYGAGSPALGSGGALCGGFPSPGVWGGWFWAHGGEVGGV